VPLPLCAFVPEQLQKFKVTVVLIMIDSVMNLDILTSIDRHFANFMLRLAESQDRALFLASALLSNATSQGHICLELTSVAGKDVGSNGNIHVVCPGLSEWLSVLQGVSVIGRPGDFTPMILDKTRLYMHRYWYYEQALIDNLLRKCMRPPVEILDMAFLQERLNRLFPQKDRDTAPDWQKVAACVALSKGFCTISGGPGTGKTTTVVKIIVLLIEQQLGRNNAIALTAPTGKAAARLQEAVLKAKTSLDCTDAVKAAIPEEVFTIHRLLGAGTEPSHYRYNEDNHLPFQIIVVDEASMVDLPLMSRLFLAIQEQARVILLGDRDQLASVQPGAVLGDICGPQEKINTFSPQLSNHLNKAVQASAAITVEQGKVKPIQDSLVTLQKNYRFGQESGIAVVSRFVKQGNPRAALELLKEKRFADIGWALLPLPNDLDLALESHIINGFKKYLETQEEDIKEAFNLFDTFRILCAIRNGPYGVENMNAIVRNILADAGLVKQKEVLWYSGRPVIITRNDYNLHLFNGDIGITSVDKQDGTALRVFFQNTDGNIRKFLPQMIPPHETAYAMTVHKSQGSEFDKALLILPDRQVEVLTRELIYTAITRAKKEVMLWGLEPVFEKAVASRIERHSGLNSALWA